MFSYLPRSARVAEKVRALNVEIESTRVQVTMVLIIASTCISRGHVAGASELLVVQAHKGQPIDVQVQVARLAVELPVTPGVGGRAGGMMMSSQTPMSVGRGFDVCRSAHNHPPPPVSLP